MSQEGFFEVLRAHTSCPMCLDLLSEPVTLDCGHNCCESCLQQRWEDLLDVHPCAPLPRLPAPLLPEDAADQLTAEQPGRQDEEAAQRRHQEEDA